MMSTAYEQMVEDIKSRIGADEEPGVLEDVANHGADVGWGGFTYYTETADFYDKHSEVIWEMLADDAENFGYSSAIEFVSSFRGSDVDDEDSFKNLLAWYALEEVSRRLVDEGAHIPECEECCSILEDDGSCFDCDSEED